MHLVSKSNKDLMGKKTHMFYRTASLPGGSGREFTGFELKDEGSFSQSSRLLAEFKIYIFLWGFFCYRCYSFLLWGHSQFLQGDVVFVFYSVLASLKTAVDSQVF